VNVLRITPRLLELLRERRVYHSLSGAERWQVGGVLLVPNACLIEPFTELLEGRILPGVLGAFSYSVSEMAGWVRVGRYSSLASGISWMGGPHPIDWAGTSPALHGARHVALSAFREQSGLDYAGETFTPPPQSVTIGHDVWIGDQAMIAPGVTIGDGAVVGARALVLKDVPSYAIVVGQPARVLRYRFSEDLIARFQAARWWRYSPAVVTPLPASQPERFLDGLTEALDRDKPEPFNPACLTTEELLATAVTGDG
jgi:acetyltransferase-like isoleucine patch superfamily enzyme